MNNEILQNYDFGEWFENIAVTFFIRSELDEFAPARISAFLGLEPSRSLTKGESYFGKALDPVSKQRYSIQRRYTMNMWEISTKGIVTSTNLQEHILYLLEILEAKNEQIQSYLAEPNKCSVVVRINVSWNWDNRDLVSTGYTLQNNLLLRVANICHQVECNFDRLPLNSSS